MLFPRIRKHLSNGFLRRLDFPAHQRFNRIGPFAGLIAFDKRNNFVRGFLKPVLSQRFKIPQQVPSFSIDHAVDE